MGSINLKQVTKRFDDVEVIKPIDLEIRDGEFMVFVGPSGCGKSTLLRIISGLEDTTSGSIEIDGKDATSLAPGKRGLAMVFQSYALYPHMSVRNNIAFPLKRAKLDKAVIEQKVQDAATKLNLIDYLDRKPSQLSGGQRQRVAIGRAIVRQPSAFLFDEPLSNLDASLRVNMRLEISELHKSLETTMVYVTHDQVEAMTMADRIAVFNHGVIEQVGSPLELYHHPVNKFVAGFIGSPKMNFIEVTPNKLNVSCIGVRPEHLQISPDNVLFKGKVGVVEHLGSESFLHITLTDGTPLTVKTTGDTTLKYGDLVELGASEKNVFYFDQSDANISQSVSSIKEIVG
jgi:multiple sugar transport system ATP-binding protein